MSETPVTPALPASPSNNVKPKKFDGDGVVFKGKLIGMEDLSIDRDEKICLDSMFKLKAVVRARGDHKQKIQLNLTMSAVKIIDDTTKAHIASHDIERISFVVTDPRDNRAFGYIFNTPDDRHQFWAIKTERAAAATVLALKELFELAFEQFTNAEKAKLEANKSTKPVPPPPVSPVNETVSTQEPSPGIRDPPPPPPPPTTTTISEPVVTTATSSILDDDLWNKSSTTTITQTTGPTADNLLDIDADPVPVIQPVPKIIDPLEDLFSNLTTTTQPATSTNNSILDFFPNAAPPLTNHHVNFPSQTANFNFVNTPPTLPQQQQQLYSLRTAPPPPLQQQQQQDLFVPRSFSPVAPPSVTNPFSGFDILGDLTTGIPTKPTKDSFFPVGPPPKTIQQLQMEKQRNPFSRS